MFYYRLNGALLGMAIGSALGLPVSKDTREEIKRKFGIDGLIDFAPSYNGPPGTISPDCELSLFLLEALLRAGEKGPDAFVLEFKKDVLRWLKSVLDKGKIPKRSNIEAAERLEEGLSWLESGDFFSDSGEVTRGVPVGVYYYDDEETLVKVAIRVAAITHKSDVSMAACVSTALAVSLCLRDYTPYEVVEEAVSMFYEVSGLKGGVLGSIFKLIDRDIDGFELEVGPGSSPELVLSRAFYSFLKFNESFERAVLSAVNMSGPSEVQGALSGALVGASRGSRAIPMRWIERVEEGERINRLSKELYRISMKKRVEGE